MKELTLERSPMNVKYVTKHSLIPVLFKNIKEHILERSHTNVKNVGEPSVFPQTLKYL